MLQAFRRVTAITKNNFAVRGAINQVYEAYTGVASDVLEYVNAICVCTCNISQRSF